MSGFDGQQSRRALERFAASRDAELITATARLQVVLQDVSLRGFKIAVDGYLPRHEPVLLCVRGLDPLPAIVMWVRFGMVGCRFDPEAQRGSIVRLIRRPRWSDELSDAALYLD